MPNVVESFSKLSFILPSYPLYDQSDFSEELVRHYEFFPESMEGSSSPWFFHQRMIARFMDAWTHYDSLFVVHEMGTGKTGVAIAVMDRWKQQFPDRKVVFLANSQVILQNFQREVQRKSLFFQQKAHEKYGSLDEMTEGRWKNVFEKHQLLCDSYQLFATKSIQPYDDRILRKQYEDCLILFDEVHHLHFQHQPSKTKGQQPSLSERIYHQLLRWIRLLEDRKKLLLLTGTPIRDQPEEVALLFQLLHPSISEFESTKRFRDWALQEKEKIRIFPNSDKLTLPVYTWKSFDRRRELFHYLQGRISFFRQHLPDIRVVYEGSVQSPLQHLPVLYHSMSSFQAQTYLETLPSSFGEEDQSSSSQQQEDEGGEEEEVPMSHDMYRDAVQSTLFVFPYWNAKQQMIQPIYGKSLFDKCIRLSDTRLSWQPRIWPLDMYQRLVEGSIDQKIEIIRECSASYAAVMESLFPKHTSSGNRRFVSEISFVYCNLVKGSGILLFALILQSFFGFTLITRVSQIQSPESRQPGRRCLLFNDLFGITGYEIQELLTYINDPSNARGEYCQMVLSTKKTQEGISLKNIQQIHILTPAWNFADISQAIARGLRAKSHDALLESKQPNESIQVRIFLHASVLDPRHVALSMEESRLRLYSIDVQRYLRSEIKDLNNKLMLRFLLEASWDCPWWLSRHQPPPGSKEGSIECDYGSCNVVCLGTSTLPEPQHRNSTIWIDEYSDQQMWKTYQRLRLVLQQTPHGYLSIQDAWNQVRQDVIFPLPFPFFSQCCFDIMIKRIPLLNRWGETCFLRIVYDHYLQLVDHPLAVFPSQCALDWVHTSRYQSVRTDWTYNEDYHPWWTKKFLWKWWLTCLSFLSRYWEPDTYSQYFGLLDMMSSSTLLRILKTLVPVFYSKEMLESETFSTWIWRFFWLVSTWNPSLFVWKSTTLIDMMTSVSSVRSVVKEWKLPNHVFMVETQVWIPSSTASVLKPTSVVMTQGSGTKYNVLLALTSDLEEKYIFQNRVIGFYGMLVPPQNQFLIRDVRNVDLFDPQKNKNKKKIPSGRACVTLDVHLLYYILLRIYRSIGKEVWHQKIEPFISSHMVTKMQTEPIEWNVLIQKTPFKKLWTLLSQEANEWKPLLDPSSVQEESLVKEYRQVLQILYYFNKLTELCPLLQTMFEYLDLLHRL